MNRFQKISLIKLNCLIGSFRFDILNSYFVFPGILSFLNSSHNRIYNFPSIPNHFLILIKIANSMNNKRVVIFSFDMIVLTKLFEFDSQTIILDSNKIVSTVNISMLRHIQYLLVRFNEIC